VADSLLPPEFADLEPWVSEWCLDSEPERYAKRLASSMDEIQAFYDAVFPRAEAAMQYLDELPLDDLPEEFREVLKGTPVTVSNRGHEFHAYGHYIGGTIARDTYPDHIVVYRDTLERDFGHDRDLLRAQVERTVRHELAHHLGWDERGVRRLGL